MSRMSRGEMFMEIAHIVAKRGTCDRAKVGAVISHKGRIISIGYNGSKPGEPHCDDIGHDLVEGHCLRTIHAEVNAINFAEEILANTKEKLIVELFVTHLPCKKCCEYIAFINQTSSRIKIKSVIYGHIYPRDLTKEESSGRRMILLEGGVETIGQLEV